MNAQEASSFPRYRSRFVHISASDVLQRLRFSESDSLLDVCCGSGELTKLVTENARLKSTTAIDINSNMIDIAKSTNNADNITYLVGDVGAAETFKSEWKNSFDKVLAYYALQWIPNWPDTIIYLYECLKPGGEGYINITIDEPALVINVIHEAAYQLPRWQQFVKGFQYKHYPLQGNEEDFDAILRKAGFVDVKVEVEKTLNFFQFDTDLQAKDFIRCFLPQLECLPDDFKEDFLEDVFLNVRSKCEKTEDGRAVWKIPTLTAMFRKE
ncbi:juvenile hormone acid O-methyltransferase-like [Saccoglossus kowalevskii]|uniref:Phosphoethanolamine N-methyltransferase 2-like n=1 Tax=Saccoglossus kowalevskii TaxID=10224 RepID=A0ABM0M595_SACKO|nr:PREDICTED: phosphoethanolamine N-methyltransferase 2-like [Saccoglossus kowalevskii]